MPAAWLVDEDGEPRRFLVKGFDRSDPQKVVICRQEVRPGGMAVYHMADDRPLMAAPPAAAPVPTEGEQKAEREARAKQSAEKDKEAARIERMAHEEEARKKAAQKEAAAKA
jgi:hypothetical protein